MDKKESIFLAKKYFTELVYNSAQIEGCNVTFPQTQTIIDGAVVNNVSVDDIQTVLNLKDAFRYLVNNIDCETNLNYICKINEFVSRNESLMWGVLRNGNIGISGTSWKPIIPKENDVETDISKLNAIENPLNRALEFFCYITKNQLFWDRNKRTALIVANKVMIENNLGIMTIDKEHALNFNESLLKYYDTNKNTDLKNCLMKCIKVLDKEINKDTIQSEKSKFLSSYDYER